MKHLGIDIAKGKFDVALLVGAKFKTKVFANDRAGFEALFKWLDKHAGEMVHAVMEATGSYGEALATALCDAGHRVSVINPARAKAYAQSLGLRQKTDTVDAKVLAQLVATQSLALWSAPPMELRTLQALVRRLDALIAMHVQEQNRLQVASAHVKDSIEQHLGYLVEQIEHIKHEIARHIDRHPGLKRQQGLLESIPGIGSSTSAWLMGEMNLMRFASAREAAAFAGVTPRMHQSGSSVRGKPRVSKQGSARLRKLLYFPAITAMRCNPVVKALSKRLEQKGKHNMAIITAAMRKLIHIAYGVLKSGKPFDPTLANA